MKLRTNRVVGCCATIDEDSNWKVNPPTCQNGLSPVAVLNCQIEDEKVALVPAKTANGLGVANTPDTSVTVGVIHDVTSVAVPGEDVSYVTPPVKTDVTRNRSSLQGVGQDQHRRHAPEFNYVFHYVV